jgi:Type IX secretion system membrane protein PorP/SprF
MQKINFLLPCLLLCSTFVQAQNLNNFNDVRPLGVLLNPAHIGLEGAKGELGVVYQLASVDYETFDNGVRGHISTTHNASANYTHYNTLKNADVLQVGLGVMTRWSSLEDFTNIGLNAAYTHRFDTKNLVSVGASLSVQEDKTAIDRLLIRMNGFGDNGCGTAAFYWYNSVRGKMIASTLHAKLNMGLETKHIFNENADIRLGFIANNLNTPEVSYDINDAVFSTKTILNYKIILKSDFMVSKKVGFAPMLIFSSTDSPFAKLDDWNSKKAFILSNDFRFKNKLNHEWRIGVMQQLYSNFVFAHEGMAFSLRYYKPRTSIGLSCFTSYPLSAQTNFQYTF